MLSLLSFAEQVIFTSRLLFLAQQCSNQFAHSSSMIFTKLENTKKEAFLEKSFYSISFREDSIVMMIVSIRYCESPLAPLCTECSDLCKCSSAQNHLRSSSINGPRLTKPLNPDRRTSLQTLHSSSSYHASHRTVHLSLHNNL